MPKLLTPPRRLSRSSGAPEGPDASGGDAARTRKKFLRRQRARRWVLVRRVLALLAVVGLVVGGVWLVFFSSVLAVHQVQVRGTDVLSAADVETAAAVPQDVPLATSDLGAIQGRVEDLAPVASAEVSRVWPDTIRIDVTERQAAAVVDWEGSWRGLDEEGVLFRTYPKRPMGLPVLSIRSSSTSEALAEAAKVVGAVPAPEVKRLDHVQVGSIDDIDLVLGDGTTIRWGSADQSADKAEVLSLLMAQQKASIYDVTAPGRPTIKP
jgi:cell division protein FtsQ